MFEQPEKTTRERETMRSNPKKAVLAAALLATAAVSGCGQQGGAAPTSTTRPYIAPLTVPADAITVDVAGNPAREAKFGQQESVFFGGVLLTVTVSAPAPAQEPQISELGYGAVQCPVYWASDVLVNVIAKNPVSDWWQGQLSFSALFDPKPDEQGKYSDNVEAVSYTGADSLGEAFQSAAKASTGKDDFTWSAKGKAYFPICQSGEKGVTGVPSGRTPVGVLWRLTLSREVNPNPARDALWRNAAVWTS